MAKCKHIATLPLFCHTEGHSGFSRFLVNESLGEPVYIYLPGFEIVPPQYSVPEDCKEFKIHRKGKDVRKKET